MIHDTVHSHFGPREYVAVSCLHVDMPPRRARVATRALAACNGAIVPVPVIRDTGSDGEEATADVVGDFRAWWLDMAETRAVLDVKGQRTIHRMVVVGQDRRWCKHITTICCLKFT